VGGPGWFLLTLLYGRIALHVLTALRAPPSLQVVWMFTVFVLISWFWDKPSYTYTGDEKEFVHDWWAQLSEIPPGILCVKHECNTDLPKGGFVETLGKIFINGGLEWSGNGYEFGFFVVYTKMFLMAAQYLFFFHYGDTVMTFVRWTHKKASGLLGSEAAIWHARLVMVIVANMWWFGDHDPPYQPPRLFNWLNLYRLFEIFGAMGMMLALYKCGAQWKTAGSTIVGYFLMGYSFPASVFYGNGSRTSASWTFALSIDDSFFAYSIQMGLSICFVVGWMHTVSVFIAYLTSAQFRVLIFGWGLLKRFWGFLARAHTKDGDSTRAPLLHAQ